MSFLPSIIALSTMAVIAMFVTVARGGIHADAAALRNTTYLAALTIGLQIAHFLEEASTGLNRRLPELFGFAPVSMDTFVSVNLIAIAIWVLSTWALTRGADGALFPLWFLAVACISNALLHPALALASGGYFPGLITSPIVGVAGILLFRRLSLITRGIPHEHL